jgi:hypothetical protein
MAGRAVKAEGRTSRRLRRLRRYLGPAAGRYRECAEVPQRVIDNRRLDRAGAHENGDEGKPLSVAVNTRSRACRTSPVVSALRMWTEPSRIDVKIMAGQSFTRGRKA